MIYIYFGYLIDFYIHCILCVKLYRRDKQTSKHKRKKDRHKYTTDQKIMNTDNVDEYL